MTWGYVRGLSAREVLARMADGWECCVGHGITHFGCYLHKGTERLSFGRNVFVQMRDAGCVRYSSPGKVALTASGLKVGRLALAAAA